MTDKILIDRSVVEQALKALERADRIAGYKNNWAETFALRAALEQPQDIAYHEAVSLAKWLFRKHFAHEEDYASGRVVWEPCDTTVGVISQIDNMVCGLVRQQPQVEQEPVAVIGDVWTLNWVGSDPIATIVKKHGLKIGDKLYTHPQNLNCKSTQHRLATLWGYEKPQPPRQPQVEQEPVTAQHRFRHPQKTMPDWSVWQPCKVAKRPAWEIDSQGYEVEYMPLYTHPQPPRQPLTDEQITELADAHMEAFAQFVGAGEVWFEGEKEFARAIEAAHGIKEQK